MDTGLDLLKIKIEKAREDLPPDTVTAIDAVDWHEEILKLRELKGYNLEQLGDLETETELVLCGLVNPAQYQSELESRMRIGRGEAAELVAYMNERVFKKIKEKLIEISEHKKQARPQKEVREAAEPVNIARATPVAPEPAKPDLVIDTHDSKVLESAGINLSPRVLGGGNVVGAKASPETRQDMLEKVEHPPAIHPILGEKISGTVQTATTKTEYTVGNLSKPPATPSREEKEIRPEPPKITGYEKGQDPYRLSPEE